MSFNPCFNGSSSSTTAAFTSSLLQFLVSILVLMEVPLQLRKSMLKANSSCMVSILVLMEVPLQRKLEGLSAGSDDSFNPCFNGSSSSTFQLLDLFRWTGCVSILVLMEVPLQLQKLDEIPKTPLLFQSLF